MGDDQTRRSFLQRAAAVLPVIRLAGVIPATPSEPAKLSSPDPAVIRADATAELYKGYAIFWTGWKSAYADARFCGQWIAWPHPRERWAEYGDKAYVVSTAPYAPVGFYRKGDQFNTAPERARVPDGASRIITFDTPIAERATACAEAKAALLYFIDTHGYRP